MLIGLVFLSQMPESPRFLISQKKFSKAREVFEWIGKINGLNADLVEERLSEIHFEGEKIIEGSMISRATDNNGSKKQFVKSPLQNRAKTVNNRFTF